MRVLTKQSESSIKRSFHKIANLINRGENVYSCAEDLLRNINESLIEQNYDLRSEQVNCNNFEQLNLKIIQNGCEYKVIHKSRFKRINVYEYLDTLTVKKYDEDIEFRKFYRIAIYDTLEDAVNEVIKYNKLKKHYSKNSKWKSVECNDIESAKEIDKLNDQIKNDKIEYDKMLQQIKTEMGMK